MNNQNPSRAIHSRRDALRFGASSAALAFAGVSTVGTAFVQAARTASPTETQGPFWVDELLNRSDVRSDPGTGVVQAGFPLRLNVSRLASAITTPISGAFVDIWHCNASGAYSDEPAGMGNPNTSGLKYLRGYQITNSHGIVRFLTIYPGWYTSRTPHIHARVRTFSGNTTTLNFTTQFFFAESITNLVYSSVAPYNTRGARDTTNSTDSVYNTVSSGSTAANPDGTRLMLRLADDGTHAIGSFNIVVT